MTAQQKANGSKIYSEIITMLVTMIEEKGDYISGHSERVAGNCSRFAKSLGLSKNELDRIYLAALLYDIGMIYIPANIIQKPSALTEDEMAIIRMHPAMAARILSPIGIFKGIVPLIRHHHELYDGTGYPDGLKQHSIPLGSRILCLVDSYEAMIAPRAHRPALTSSEALDFISRHAGKRFDPDLARQFIEFIRSNPDVSAGIKKEKKSQDIREVVIDIVRKLKKGEIVMPVLPKVVSQIQQVINRPDSTTEDLARIVERDGVISVKLIAIGNSSVYRGAETFTSVRQAITRLGFKQTNSIITAIAARNLYRTPVNQCMKMMERLWLHSLATAYCARELGHRLGQDDPEKLFLQGLLHDIGMTLLLKAIGEMPTRENVFEKHVIHETLKEFHPRVGGALLQQWHFPKDFIRVAEQHENQQFFDTTPTDILIVHFANRFACKTGYPVFDDEDSGELWEQESAKLLQLSPDTLFSVTERVTEIMQDSAAMF